MTVNYYSKRFLSIDYKHNIVWTIIKVIGIY